MYNLIHGRNPFANLLLDVLGLDERAVGRFRDAFVAEGEIAVYTRNGDGNRRCWNATPGADCDCPGCAISYRLPAHPLYLRDEDDGFDSTYATVYFRIPDDAPDFVRAMDVGKFDPDARWKAAFEYLRTTPPDKWHKTIRDTMVAIEKILNG